MDVFIFRDEAIDNLCESCLIRNCSHDCDAVKAIRGTKPADVVARDCYDRILAENDTMREQLTKIGKKPGDQMYDVRSVQRAKWIVGKRETRCSGCGWQFHKYMKNMPYCPICAADMVCVEGE